jgi:hypothetical protein
MFATDPKWTSFSIDSQPNNHQRENSREGFFEVIRALPLYRSEAPTLSAAGVFVTGDAEMLRFEEAGSSLFQVRFRTKKPGRGGRQPGSSQRISADAGALCPNHRLRFNPRLGVPGLGLSLGTDRGVRNGSGRPKLLAL